MAFIPTIAFRNQIRPLLPKSSRFARTKVSHPRHNTTVCTIMSQTLTKHEETFDILDSNGVQTGRSKARSLVHRDGDWHASTHIWILRNDGALLLQKRAPDKDTFPNMWDVSAAGHVTSGGESRLTAERELEEELGVNLNMGGFEMDFLFRERSQNCGETKKHGMFQDNEFQDVYILKGKDIDEKDFELQEEEVAEIRYVHYTELQRRLECQDPMFVPRPAQYQKRFFKWLSEVYNGHI